MIKVKIVVFDLTGSAMDWLDKFGNEDHIELCEVITLDDDSPIKITELPLYDNWDYLLIFEDNLRTQVDELLMKLGIPDDKILFPLDIYGSLTKQIQVSMYMFKGYVYRYLKYLQFGPDGDKYAVAEAPGMRFMNLTTDSAILPTTYISGEVWSQKEMDLFYKLSDEYFAFNSDQSIFCDIGANIGTTSIYFKKELEPDINILAFEPSIENFKMLQINAILNDISLSKNRFVNMGLSDKKSEGVLSFNPENPGGSTLHAVSYGVEEKGIQLISFDEYIEENMIDIKRIKYFWVDVEGFEARFLMGARKTLSEIRVPFLMEFIPKFYMSKDGEFELLMQELESHFDSYIYIGHPDEGIFPVHDLWREQNNVDFERDLFLFKR